MTSKPLTFYDQHLCWQQRVSKERGKTLQFHDEDPGFKTFDENFPKYLEQLDKKKMKNFRQSHPIRYQPPPSDTESNASRRFNSIKPRSNKASHLSLQGNNIVASGSSQGRRYSSTSNSLLGMKTKADGFNTNQERVIKVRKGLHELLHENNLYSNVIAEISQRLALKEAVNSAHEAIQEKKSQKKEMFSEHGSEITSLSKAERLIDAFQTVKVGPKNRPSNDVASSYKYGIAQQKLDLQEQLAKYRSKKAGDSVSVFSKQPSHKSNTSQMIKQLQAKIDEEKSQGNALQKQIEAIKTQTNCE